jgi:dTDP-4-amino-4,6-dideoxygalactose transaminase
LHTQANKTHTYYPVIFESESLLLAVKAELDAHEIFTRRYFYPSLANTLPYVQHVDMPITDDIAKRVLCLPLYYELTMEEVDLISRIILRVQNN